MKRRAFFGGGLAAVALSGCAANKFKRYNGPEVTRVVVQKSQRQIYLLHGNEVLKSYPISLGSNPIGPKMFEGDGRTPEGSFFINRRNPNSEFHLSLGISYPTEADVTRANALGLSPGGDIFVHGERRNYSKTGRDWTAGCIAVSDKAIEQIYAMVRDGTQIDINP
jgi:murein L,D-transpeptidase YafK